MPNAQDLRCAAGWRAGCSAGGMPAKAIRSGHWLASILFGVSVVMIGDKLIDLFVTAENNPAAIETMEGPNLISGFQHRLDL